VSARQLCAVGPASGPIPDGELVYLPSFVSPAAADRLLSTLLDLPDWKRERLTIFGRQVYTPRLTAWYGDPGIGYAYSGVVHTALPWLEELLDLRARMSAELSLSFNGVLANRYRDGRDSMGWHSDDERELGPRPVIASISLGARRRFLLRHRSRKDLATLELSLEHGSLLLMKGDTQHHWRHSVPKAARCTSERVNLTFRRILG
jgi:alkylated DNA repair dioxygenase AlkB